MNQSILHDNTSNGDSRSSNTDQLFEDQCMENFGPTPPPGQQKERLSLHGSSLSTSSSDGEPVDVMPQTSDRSIPESFQPGICIPLRQWMQCETDLGYQSVQLHKETLLRKTTVAYAVSELLIYIMKHNPFYPNESSFARRSSYPSAGGIIIGKMNCILYQPLNTNHLCISPSRPPACKMDNFVVRVFPSAERNAGSQSWNNIEGVDMIAPALSLQIILPFISNDFFNVDNRQDEGGEETQDMGFNLDVDMGSDLPYENAALSSGGGVDRSDELLSCHLFGALVYELFSTLKPYLAVSASVVENNADCLGEPSKKKSMQSSSSFSLPLQMSHTSQTTNNDDSRESVMQSQMQQAKYHSLQELGFPTSISLLVRDLLDCGWVEQFQSDNSYPSLRVASRDLHMLVRDPTRFLFGYRYGGSTTLQVNKDKLYGRDKESSLITDTFCRVSLSGTSEALLIGGYSGSGKSRIVQSIFGQVACAGGYIISQKFDEQLRESALSAVLAAFDKLCLLIAEKNSPQDIQNVVNDLVTVFGPQLSSLVRVLPNINILLQGASNAKSDDHRQPNQAFYGLDDTSNLNSIKFILQMFMRVVSSSSRPVMLFLDDLQWADSSLDIVHSILSDIGGSSCVFFVGTYRDNEVKSQPNHPLYQFIRNLHSSNVNSTVLYLDGLQQDDLNELVSDALGIFPRLCLSLSAEIHRKTKGNPLFVSEFLGSLVHRGLLQFSVKEGHWVWDEEKINAEDMTENVIHLVSTKMSDLPADTKTTLMIASCFGSKIHSNVISLLNSTSKYSFFTSELNNAVAGGYMVEDRSDYRFVHDKIREASYRLIQANEQKKFHFDIGMLMFYSGDYDRMDGTNSFVIADQISYGLDMIVYPPQRHTIAELFRSAALKAMKISSFTSARSYARAAESLLPTDCFNDSSYHLSMKILTVLGKACSACGDVDEAKNALSKILTNGRSLEVKLDAYYYMIQLMIAQQEMEQAYESCSDVLSQLGETIPSAVDQIQVSAMISGIGQSLGKMSDSEVLGMSEMDDSRMISLVHFYDQIASVSFFANQKMFVFYSCKLVTVRCAVSSNRSSWSRIDVSHVVLQRDAAES